MKHKISRRVVLALTMCVACVLAFGATFVRADENSKAAESSRLTITLSGSESGESQVKGLQPEVKLYQVAHANPDDVYDTYNYDFKGTQFESLASEFDQQTYTAKQWKDLVDKTKARVNESTEYVPAKVGEAKELENGLYLVIIPDVANVNYKFTFEPVLVSLPYKVDSTGTPVTNTSEGTWTNDVTASYALNVKWSMEQRYGSLQINKTVRGFDGQPATFTYRIADEETDGKVYENYAAVQYTSEGIQSATVGHIPAGMRLTVTEVDTGARYQIVGDVRDESKPATIVADQSAPVDFENEPNGSGKFGHGIENHFVVVDDGQGPSWKREVHVVDQSEDIKEGDAA